MTAPAPGLNQRIAARGRNRRVYQQVWVLAGAIEITIASESPPKR